MFSNWAGGGRRLVGLVRGAVLLRSVLQLLNSVSIFSCSSARLGKRFRRFRTHLGVVCDDDGEKVFSF